MSIIIYRPLSTKFKCLNVSSGCPLRSKIVQLVKLNLQMPQHFH